MNYKVQKHVSKIGRFIVLFVYLLIVVLPIYWMIATALKTNSEVINAQHITYYPHKISYESFTELFRLYDYGNLVKNSLIVSFATGICVTLLSIFGGYSLARFKFKSKSVILLFFLVTQMIPAILVIIPLYIMFVRLNLVNTRIGLFIFYLAMNLPFCAITMRSFFERIPYTLEEAASVDGCSRMTILYKIVLPIMFPGIVAVFVFAFIGAWNELIAGTIFISTPDLWTIPVGLKSLIGKYDVKWGLLMAGGVFALLPTAIMFAFMQKFVVEGLTSGAVKE
jgi:multiple sugar transport system permease protein